LPRPRHLALPEEAGLVDLEHSTWVNQGLQRILADNIAQRIRASGLGQTQPAATTVRIARLGAHPSRLAPLRTKQAI